MLQRVVCIARGQLVYMCGREILHTSVCWPGMVLMICSLECVFKVQQVPVFGDCVIGIVAAKAFGSPFVNLVDVTKVDEKL